MHTLNSLLSSPMPNAMIAAVLNEVHGLKLTKRFVASVRQWMRGVRDASNNAAVMDITGTSTLEDAVKELNTRSMDKFDDVTPELNLMDDAIARYEKANKTAVKGTVHKKLREDMRDAVDALVKATHTMDQFPVWKDNKYQSRLDHHRLMLSRMFKKTGGTGAKNAVSRHHGSTDIVLAKNDPEFSRLLEISLDEFCNDAMLAIQQYRPLFVKLYDAYRAANEKGIHVIELPSMASRTCNVWRACANHFVKEFLGSGGQSNPRYQADASKHLIPGIGLKSIGLRSLSRAW